MSSHPPPSEGSDSSFWASVYTHEPSNVLCGVITDINLHRFTLHQQLTTHRALTETPLLHPPFQRALPDALHTHLQLYTSSIHQIEVPTPDELLPGRTIHLPPITRRNLSGTSPTAHVLQHTSAQTTPTQFHNQSTQTDTILETLRLHEEQ